MKTLKKAFAVGLVAAFASAGFAAQAGADHTEPIFTLEIDPSQGLPGQTINATVPADGPDGYVAQCDLENPAAAQIAALFAALIAGGELPALDEVAAGILEGAFEADDLQDLLGTILFVLLFVDPATQDPVSNPGEDHWDPSTGQGSIVAPGVDENPDSPNAGQVLDRPAVYLVAAACLGLKDLDEAAAAAIEALAAELGAIAAATQGNLEAFLGCVLQQDQQACGAVAAILTPEGLEALGEEFGESIEGIITALLTAVIDDDPDVAWVAPFCLLGGNGEIENCDIEEVPVAEPVPAEVTFAG